MPISFRTGRSARLVAPIQTADVPERPQLCFTTGETVFRAMDERHAYRVESGAICEFSRHGPERFSVIDFAFSGDIVGLGYMTIHSSTAVAMVDTTVVLVSPAELELAVISDDQLSYSLAEAGEREFEYLRAKTINTPPLAPVERLANFLLAILGASGERGTGELIIPDDVTSGFVADQLRMSVDTLAMALLSLRRSGAVEVSSSGLHVLDVERLQLVAGAV